MNNSIAIVGIAAALPKENFDLKSIWQTFKNNENIIGPLPQDRAIYNLFQEADQVIAPKTVKNGGFFSRYAAETFDGDFFGISPAEIHQMDYGQRLAYTAIWRGIQNAGMSIEEIEKRNVGFILSGAGQHVAFDPKQMNRFSAFGFRPCESVGRVANFFNSHGPAYCIDTACASSLCAVHLACQSLLAGDCDIAITGGMNLLLGPSLSLAFTKASMMSPEWRCKTFDASADGYVRSEAYVIYVVKRLEDAIKDRDRIWAVILGSAVNHVGTTESLTAPGVAGQSKVINKAITAAGISADDVEYVEIHGTGTPIGDPIEIEAISSTYGKNKSEKPIYVGACKPYVGHSEMASGAVGLLKTILSLQNDTIVGSPHVKKFNPKMSLTQRMVIPSTAVEWPRREQPRIAAVSSFGYGGTNAHVIVADAPMQPQKIKQTRDIYYIKVCAKSPASLGKQCEAYVQALEHLDEAQLADFCFTSLRGRSDFKFRKFVIGSSKAELSDRLRAESGNDTNIFIGPADQNHKVDQAPSLQFEIKTSGLSPVDWEQLYEFARAFVNGRKIDWNFALDKWSDLICEIPEYVLDPKFYPYVPLSMGDDIPIKKAA